MINQKNNMKLFIKIYYVLKKYDKRFYIENGSNIITIKIKSLDTIHKIFTMFFNYYISKYKYYINYGSDEYITNILNLIKLMQK